MITHLDLTARCSASDLVWARIIPEDPGMTEGETGRKEKSDSGDLYS